MALSVTSLLPFTLLIAPISLFCLMLALKKRKVWLIRISLLGLVLTAVLLVLSQYLDYKHFVDCLLQGADYSAFSGDCIQFTN
ncbi:hypothetical protein C942_04642 [Photobacterium marinum]|uniref:Uncharacterized protein n=1 Tax=Photobacterium marinum TaxID=1056511 RepID=L8JFC2_9GAMM|nr:hypothetical protein C942_04642 [Photobacterium marinum]